MQKKWPKDADTRATERKSLLSDYHKVRDEAGALLTRLRKDLLALQRAAAASDRVPAFETAPAFVDKSMPTISPDGKVSGLVISVSGLTSHPGVRELRTEYARKLRKESSQLQ